MKRSSKLTTKEAWRKRQERWRRFNEWEQAQEDKSTPAERVHRACELADLFFQMHPEARRSEEKLNAKIEGLRKMRRALAKLRSEP